MSNNWNRYQYRDENRVLSLAFALAVVAAAIMFACGHAKAEDPTPEESAAADLRREAEWLALQDGRYSKETLKADEQAVQTAVRMLREARRYPEVADVSVLPVVREAVIAMDVPQGEMGVEIPSEVFSLCVHYGASMAVQYGEKAGDVGIVRIYFFQLLHTPSLISEFGHIKGVANVRDEAAPPPSDSDVVTFEYDAKDETKSLLKIRRLRGKTEMEKQWVVYTFGYIETHSKDDPSGNYTSAIEFNLLNTEYTTEKIENK